MRTLFEKTALIIGLLSALTAATGATVLAPQFESVFTSLGAELPAITKHFLNYHHALWLLPICVFTIWYKVPPPKIGALCALLAGILGLTLTFLFSVIAVYEPIFNLEPSAQGF